MESEKNKSEYFDILSMFMDNSQAEIDIEGSYVKKQIMGTSSDLQNVDKEYVSSGGIQNIV